MWFLSFLDFFPPFKLPHHRIKVTAKAVKVWTPPVVHRPLRVACLHGTCSNGHITKASRIFVQGQIGVQILGLGIRLQKMLFLYVSYWGNNTSGVFLFLFFNRFFSFKRWEGECDSEGELKFMKAVHT